MSAPITSDDLIDLVRKSGLLDESKLTAFLQSHQEDGLLAGEPRKVAVVMIRESLITHFQAEQFLMGKWRGFTLGKFKLLERVGVGQMGQVFLCEHRLMRKRMAVKVLPPTKAGDPVSLGRFYREARVASGLEHPNIVRTYDIDQDGPLHFLVMEYVDGNTLLDIVKKFGPLNAVRAAHYIRMAAMGLDYAHKQGMIHRDIKPGNIIVARNGVAKLLDMGLARFSHDDTDQITVKYDDKNVLGTADYVAPEQTRDARNIDGRADIYGMGASFYFVLAGQPPFPDGSIADKIVAHQTRKPTPLREVRPDVPAGLAKIIDKMMAKDPNDRYQTPGAIVDALEIWTQTPIEPPSVEEMPKHSPVAMEPLYAGAPTPAHIRPGDPARIRPTSKPELALTDLPESEFETAATVPVPPSRPAASASVVDLVLPPPTKSSLQVARLAPSSESPEIPPPRPALTDTPNPPTRPTQFPNLELPKLPADLARLAPSRASGALRQKFAEIPKPSDGPKTPAPAVMSPLALEQAKPSSPSEPVKTFPSLREALRDSAVPDLTKPPVPDPSRKSTLEPQKPSAPAHTSGSREPPWTKRSDSPRSSRLGMFVTPPPSAPETSRLPAGKISKQPPAYRPPTLMPFIDQPVMPKQPPGATRLLRWVLMMLISPVIGAVIGVAIWYQFLRH